MTKSAVADACRHRRLAAVVSTRAVLTNGHTGLVPRAPVFFLFEGPPTGCGEINFLLPSQRSTVRENRQILSSEGPRSAGGAQGRNAGKDATGLDRTGTRVPSRRASGK